MAELDLDSTFIPALHKPSALLPIAKHRDSLLYVVETFPVTIVIGQTGSGKSTQIPQFLERAGWCSDGKIIGVTQVSICSYTKLLHMRTLIDIDKLAASRSRHNSCPAGC
jgi:hypothetical protein